MKNEERKEKKEEFLRLRVVEGKSFESISKLLGVSKRTLLRWAKELEDDMRNLEEEEKERLIEEYKLWKRERLECLLKLREKILKEIEQRDMKDIPFTRLFEMLISIEGILNKNLNLSYVIGETKKSIEEQLIESVSKTETIKEVVCFENKIRLDKSD